MANRRFICWTDSFDYFENCVFREEDKAVFLNEIKKASDSGVEKLQKLLDALEQHKNQTLSSVLTRLVKLNLIVIEKK